MASKKNEPEALECGVLKPFVLPGKQGPERIAKVGSTVSLPTGLARRIANPDNPKVALLDYGDDDARKAAAAAFKRVAGAPKK